MYLFFWYFVDDLVFKKKEKKKLGIYIIILSLYRIKNVGENEGEEEWKIFKWQISRWLVVIYFLDNCKFGNAS